MQIDARIVSATNMARDDLLDKLKFRQDLLYRINTVEIHVPPLRERPDDIGPLIDHYAQRFAKKYGKTMAAGRRPTRSTSCASTRGPAMSASWCMPSNEP